MTLKHITLCLGVALGLVAHAKVVPASLIADNMVLQQQSAATLWGKATPRATVSATPSWDGKCYSTQADARGNWSLEVNTPQASFTKHSITISDGDAITINGVLVGEVWLASGQSNMEMPLEGFGGACTAGGMDEVAFSGRWENNVRFFTVPRDQQYQPAEDTKGSWAIPSPAVASKFSAVAWHYATTLSQVLQVPVGVVSCAYGGATVESWTSREILETYPDVSLDPADIEKIVFYERPLLAYNAMFMPVRHYTYRGIIWYQGCSNVGRHNTYAQRLANMVNLWRKEIGQGDIPFYAVEIAPYDYEGHQDEMSPYLREAQWQSLKLIPNSDMVCTNDLVEPHERFNIHPGKKLEVGRRLCYLALNRTYGMKQFFCRNLIYKSHSFKGNEAWVAIDNLDMGICRNYDIRGFEVAGEDRVFHPVDTAWLHWQTNEVVVSSKAVAAPVAVRYCFRDFQIGTLYGANWLPLIPFRTDNWDK